MSELAGWDWETGERVVADINEWHKKFTAVRELIPSDDGEKVATAVRNNERRFTTCVNGEAWEETFERVYSLMFTPDNRLISLALRDYEWSINIDHEMGEERFDYVWNLTISPDGKNIAANISKDNMTGVCHNGVVWENMFFETRDVAMSPDGTKTAAHVLVNRRKELDNFAFMNKNWTVAVDGNVWDTNFINVWGAVFSSDGSHVASCARTAMALYTIAVDGKAWEQTFPAVWEPICKPGSNDFLAPVQTPKGWTIAMDGKPVWGNFSQVWRPVFSVDGKRLAAVVAVSYGNWTVAVDGSPWGTVFNQLVMTPVFSSDGKRVAVVVKDKGAWTVAVDGSPWPERYDNAWDPVFSPAGDKVAAKVEKNKKYFLAVNGKIGKKGYEVLWSPTFSPDGSKLLVRCVDNGRYCRLVVPVNEI
jgi:hypothetical protein